MRQTIFLPAEWACTISAALFLLSSQANSESATISCRVGSAYCTAAQASLKALGIETQRLPTSDPTGKKPDFLLIDTNDTDGLARLIAAPSDETPALLIANGISGSRLNALKPTEMPDICKLTACTIFPTASFAMPETSWQRLNPALQSRLK